MKTSYLLTAFFLFSVVSVFAQERPRYFDNFDTVGSVRVSRPAVVVTDNTRKVTTKSSDRVVRKPYLPSPPVYPSSAMGNPAAEIRLVKKTAQVTMTVYDGYAQPEAPRLVTPARMAMGAGSHLKGFSTGDNVVDSYIVDSSRRYGIDPLLIFAQMSTESAFKPGATSNKGASGLMQLMPATARRLGVTNIYDPKQNIEGGVKYMRMLLDMFSGDVSLALAGYNAGENAVMKYGYQIPPYNETQNYVRLISARYRSISGTTASNSQMAGRFSQKESRPSNRSEAFAPKAIRVSDGTTRLVNR